jgi:hypothetical protein
MGQARTIFSTPCGFFSKSIPAMLISLSARPFQRIRSQWHLEELEEIEKMLGGDGMTETAILRPEFVSNYVRN